MHSINSSKLIVLILLITTITFTAKSQTESKTKYLIKGKVTHSALPLSDVNIIIKNTGIGTKTDQYGNYSLRALKDDILQFSYIGYSTISIKIKNDKKIINIEMIPETYVLEEAVLKKVKRKSKNLRESDKSFETSKGTIDPRPTSYRISYLKGDEILSYSSIVDAILSRISSYKIKINSNGVEQGFIRDLPVIWDVDGFVTDTEPPLILSDIKDIRILGSSAATVNYGMRCRGVGGVGSLAFCGGVIVVRMKKGHQEESTPEEKNKINKILSSIKNTNRIEKYNNLYSETLRNIDDTNKAFTYCEKVLNRKKSIYHNDLQLINDFLQLYQNVDLFKNLSIIFVKKYSQNIHALKAIAYKLQALQIKDEYLKIYKKIFNQEKKNAQSYRDLANAFIENSDFKNALRLYLNYLRISNSFSKKNIDQLIYNELEWLYYNKKNAFSSQYKFIPNNKSKEEFSKDMRLVLEWNNPKASFNVKFDNNEKGLTIYERKYSQSSEEENFSIEEFLISKLGQEDWSIDLIYFGHEKKVTYFKATCYFNWGKENQYYKIKTFVLNGDYEKIHLFKLSSKFIIRE
jgi:tetratricopeptide (TPR) repeat protein